MYIAVAKLEDGDIIQVCGDINQCANWADNMIRMSNGAITIEIERMEE